MALAPIIVGIGIVLGSLAILRTVAKGKVELTRNETGKALLAKYDCGFYIPSEFTQMGYPSAQIRIYTDLLVLKCSGRTTEFHGRISATSGEYTDKSATIRDNEGKAIHVIFKERSTVKDFLTSVNSR